MASLFLNPVEGRIRAGWRVIFYLTSISIALMAITWLIPPSVYRYLAIAFATTLITAWVGRITDYRTFREFGMALSPLWWREFWVGNLIALGLVGLVFAGGVWSGVLEITGKGWEETDLLRFWRAWLGYLIIMLCVGYYEELIFRGYLALNVFEAFYRKNYARSWVPGIISVTIIALLFGIAHFYNPNKTWFGLLNVALAGIMLGIPYLATGRLGLSIGLHFSWNFVQGGLLGIPVSGLPVEASLLVTTYTDDGFYSGSAFGLEGGLLGTITILLILFTLGIYLYKKGYARVVHPGIAFWSPAPVPYRKSGGNIS